MRLNLAVKIAHNLNMANLNQIPKELPAPTGKGPYAIPAQNHTKLALSMINRGGLSHDQKMTAIRKANAVLAGRK